MTSVNSPLAQLVRVSGLHPEGGVGTTARVVLSVVIGELAIIG